MIEKITIDELKTGHYVVDIIEQEGNYNLTDAGHIKSLKAINTIKEKGIKSLFIDSSQTLGKNIPATTSLDPVLVEIKKAKRLFNLSKAIQRDVFDDALKGNTLNMAPIVEITNKTMTTIFENHDALACVINIRKKDDYLLEHSVSVSILITIFAHFLKLDKNIIHQLSIGAFLHDVGKILIPEKILNKPGKLTDEEFDVMKDHVKHSVNIIKKTPTISKLSLEVAALHHEKLNGNGYPLKVPANKISTYGRMIAICDIFDALTANRCYKQGYSHIQSFSVLRKLGKDNHLDLKLVDLFIKCMGIYPVGSLVELSSHKLAIVESGNEKDPVNPKVRYFYDAKSQNYINTKALNLAEEEDFITKGIRPDDFSLKMDDIIEFLLKEG